MSEINSKLCEKLEKVIFVDPGQRGVSKCWINGCLFDAAEKLLKCDKKKVSYILTGFCCMHENCETDGPIGTSVLCNMLRFLGFNSQILCDKYAKNVVSAAALDSPVVVAESVDELEKDLSFCVSIERPGRAEKTNDYRTMRARDISNVTAPLDYLFPNNKDPASKKPYLTVSVGDGGNEVGTGNIMNKIIENVPMGDQICTISSCDVLVMAGVSNWGGIAIAAALAITSENREAGKYFIELCGKQQDMLRKMIEQGSYDGVSGNKIEAIDGMMFTNEHTQINNDLVSVVKEKFNL